MDLILTNWEEISKENFVEFGHSTKKGIQKTKYENRKGSKL